MTGGEKNGFSIIDIGDSAWRCGSIGYAVSIKKR